MNQIASRNYTHTHRETHTGTQTHTPRHIEAHAHESTHRDMLLCRVTLCNLMKAGDMGHVMFDWRLHEEWMLRQMEEGYQQGDHEKLLALPVSPLCDRDQHAQSSKLQFGFIKFIVLVPIHAYTTHTHQTHPHTNTTRGQRLTMQPLFEELADLDESEKIQ